MSKLKLIKILIIFGFLDSQCTFIAQAQENLKNQTNNKFEFQPLPYAYDALEPFIDKQTVEIHYSKHHKAYYDNFINAIKGT
ncbi:MAG: hypothetical protein Q8910_17065, partial [Bacteroidota bacterium]|nr:hypothetical protein [Bacteroidota bacterium]